MPVFIPKGKTPEERRIDSNRFRLLVLITYGLMFVVPVISSFIIPPEWTTGSRFGDLSFGFGWVMFSGANGIWLSDLYVRHRTRGILSKDILELCAVNLIMVPVAGMLLAGIVLYIHSS